ncbi:hypothetical protein NUU61_001546 [Penicillium alfredii]|uniref:Uncharacterized protein n=1 Tax=Penicillium alfredii TaxID=1506179 RepID=A0A9W9KND1_9EURO|nr:uncharacterized protein NUU61_001546 [Penicillium alfredii]KAJ5111916.1 hypothetical protein NUU61_001546 [Penicillium alfredii]
MVLFQNDCIDLQFASLKLLLAAVLEQSLSRDEFTFYDGSQVIADVAPRGLEAFQKLDDKQKTYLRERVIGKIE